MLALLGKEKFWTIDLNEKMLFNKNLIKYSKYYLFELFSSFFLLKSLFLFVSMIKLINNLSWYSNKFIIKILI